MADQHAHAADQHADGHEHHHSVNYTAIFLLLCVCTGLSWVFDLMKGSFPRSTLLVLVFAVALCKATFVLLYFMHIRFERAWKYVLLAPTAVLAVALPFALAPDMAFHYYTVAAPQLDLQPVAQGSGHGSSHGGDHAGDEGAAAHAHPTDAIHADGHADKATPPAQDSEAKHP